MISQEKLTKLYKDGKLTEEEFKKALTLVPPPQPSGMTVSHGGSKVENFKQTMAPVFRYDLEKEHYEHRMDIKEGFHHMVGCVLMPVVGAIDSVIEVAFYMASELVNDATYGTSRIIFRAKDGWQKGRIR